MARKKSGMTKFFDGVMGRVNDFGRTKLLLILIFASLLFVRLPTVQRTVVNDTAAYSFKLADEPIALSCLSSLTGSGSMPAEEVGDRAVAYINNYLTEAGGVTLTSVEDKGGYYEIMTSYQGQVIPVYTTKDGDFMFLSAFDLTAEPQQQVQQETAAPEVPKADVPVAHAFVMSYCPYGLQFLKAYVPVMELLGGKADLQVNFVSYAMHGEKELTENSRMYCIQHEQGALFTDYLRCFVETDDAAGCISQVGVNEAQLTQCMNDLDEQFNITGLYNDQSTWSGGSYPQYPVEAALNQQYGVGGSPTFVLNGQPLSVTRSAEAIKQAVCAGFIEPPEECNVQLSTAAEQPGLGAIGSGSGEAAAAAQCS
jgi:protein-disulfide isomerase